MMNGSQIKIEENKQEDTKIIPLKDKYKKQEEHENESIILKEEDIKKMFQISSRKLTLNPNNYNITNEEQQQNTDLMELTSSFKKFLRKLLFYFMGIILSTSLVIITILCYLEYHFSDICIYTAFFGWCLLNLIFFLLLNNQSLSRERKIYEFSELLIISFIIVFLL